MALKAPKNQNKQDFVEQPQMEAGSYPARVVQIIDLGLQAQRPYLGKEKAPANEVMLTYEFVDCFMVDKDGNDIEDKPRWLSEILPWFGPAVEKSKSAQRYKAFDPDDAFDGDLGQCIETPVNVTVVLNKSKDKVYTNVASVAAMRPRDAAKCPELVNPPKVFDLDNPDMDIFNALPEWIREKIKGNLNYAASALEKALGGDDAKKPEEEKPKDKKPAKARDVPQDDAAEDEDEENPW